MIEPKNIDTSRHPFGLNPVYKTEYEDAVRTIAIYAKQTNEWAFDKDAIVAWIEEEDSKPNGLRVLYRSIFHTWFGCHVGRMQELGYIVPKDGKLCLSDEVIASYYGRFPARE